MIVSIEDNSIAEIIVVRGYFKQNPKRDIEHSEIVRLGSCRIKKV